MISTLIRDRTPVMYFTERCPKCDSDLPSNDQLLKRSLALRGQYHALEDLDRWYCPICSYCFAYTYFVEDLSWFDKRGLDEGEDNSWLFGEPFDYLACCGVFGIDCECTSPVPFDESFLELAYKGITERDFYHLNDSNPGVDCSSCMSYMKDTCKPLCDSLVTVVRSNLPPHGNVTPCADYIYDPTRVGSYHFGTQTPQTVIVAYPETRKALRNA